MTAAAAESRTGAGVGRTELGTITIADGVVSKIAARAAAENPDAGAAAARGAGPGGARRRAPRPARHRPGRAAEDIRGCRRVESVPDPGDRVRWPASVPDVTDQVRSHLRSRVAELTGLAVEEVHIVVADLVTDITPPPRVR